MDLTVVVHEERGSYWAEVSELPGCFASGRTVDELVEALAEAVGLYLWDLPAELHGAPTGAGETRIVASPLTGGAAPEGHHPAAQRRRGQDA